MRASTFVVAFAASAYAAGVDSTDKFDEITAPQGQKAVAEGKLPSSNIMKQDRMLTHN